MTAALCASLLWRRPHGQLQHDTAAESAAAAVEAAAARARRNASTYFNRWVIKYEVQSAIESKGLHGNKRRVLGDSAHTGKLDKI